MLLFVSGKYGGFRAMLPLIEECAKRTEVSLLLCDQHLRSDHGEGTVNEAFKLKPANCRIELGRIYPRRRVPNLFSTFDKVPPKGLKAVVVYGDRLDALLATAWGYEYGIPVMHLQAGDISGGVDDYYRCAISHMASEHFAPDGQAYDRLRSFGIPKERIHIVGDHHLDAILRCRQNPEPAREKLIIAHLHSDTMADEEENRRIADVFFGALTLLEVHDGYQVVALKPCTDRLREAVMPPKHVTLVEHIPMEEYVPALQRAALFTGNSSTAIIECPVLNTPVVTVGLRQMGRDWRMNVRCETPEGLAKSMREEIKHPAPLPNKLRGEGDAWEKTIKVLETRGLV